MRIAFPKNPESSLTFFESDFNEFNYILYVLTKQMLLLLALPKGLEQRSYVFL